MKLLKLLWSNRPFRTFLQGFMGVFMGSQLLEIKDVNMLKTLIISAIMAGISALMNLNTGEIKQEITTEVFEELENGKGDEDEQQ